ncbi:MAG: alkaline phosphatase D family protein [Verrucomicrobiae bacterium]|nr:alkaline phosphatase D family protein [Verrucomicrobiae bacterium]
MTLSTASLTGVAFLLSLISSISAELTNGQGEMAGEATATSVILQSRLTDGDKMIDGDLPGREGVGYFEIAANESFQDSQTTEHQIARADEDFIIKIKVSDLKPGTDYYYRLVFGAPDAEPSTKGPTRRFRTLDPQSVEPVSFVVVTGMNYAFFHDHPYNPELTYTGPDKHLGYPALEAILKRKPDYFIGTGDNVYYDHPAKPAAKTEAELRRKWHEQFAQPRFVKLFSEVATYWEKDDHDHRKNDCDTTGDYAPSNELGIALFREQMPVVDPADAAAPTYRTHRLNRHSQIWLLEGRDFRSPNAMPDGPEKSLWGAEQLAWLKQSLLESDATWKLIITPTPMIGPDDASKKDNHTNPAGFKYEGDAFKSWLIQQGTLADHTLLICGDRHWQYHSIDANGIEEFSCGALVDANSRAGRLPGDKNSTDPKKTISQPWVQATKSQASGGFLEVTIREAADDRVPEAWFEFFDEHGQLLYRKIKRP